MHEIILKNHTREQRDHAGNLLLQFESFDFTFKTHLMRVVLAITKELSKALQQKDQDIANAMKSGQLDLT